MNDKSRIEEIRRLSGLNWKELAAKLGMKTSQTFTDIKSGRHGISKGLAAKIHAAFPDIRQAWLLTGDGPMTEQESAVSIPLYESAGEAVTLIADSSNKTINVGSCFQRADMALRYLGDSMAEYPNGCILVLRRVEDMRLIVPGSDYVVETNDFCVVKRLQKGSDANHIALYSTNRTTYPDGKAVYEPFEVPIESVKRIFSVIGYIYTKGCEIVPAKA